MAIIYDSQLFEHVTLLTGGAAHWPPSHPATSSTPSFRPALPLPALCLPCQEMVVTYTPLDTGLLLWRADPPVQWSQWSTCQNFSINPPPPEMNHVKPTKSEHKSSMR